MKVKVLKDTSHVVIDDRPITKVAQDRLEGEEFKSYAALVRKLNPGETVGVHVQLDQFSGGTGVVSRLMKDGLYYTPTRMSLFGSNL